eukprot:jgi/Mesen1/10998/ME000097S10574
MSRRWGAGGALLEPITFPGGVFPPGARDMRAKEAARKAAQHDEERGVLLSEQQKQAKQLINV